MSSPEDLRTSTMTQVDLKTVEKHDGASKQPMVKRQWFEILTILTVALVYLSNGLVFFWTSPILPKIVEDKVNYNITQEEASYFTVIRTVSLVFLTPFLGSVTNSIGRKKLLISTSIPYAATWIIKAFCTNLWLLYFARFLAGISDAIIFLSAYAFVGEIASPEVRGVWGNFLTIFCFLGQLLINIIGNVFSIQVTSFICIIVPIIFFIVFPFFPESPYFYITKGKYNEAKASLRTLRRKNSITDEFVLIKNALANEEYGTWKDLVTIRPNRKALIISIFLGMSQILSGIWTFGPYLQYIFQKAGTNMSAEMSTILYCSVNLVLFTVAAYSSNLLGRRKSLILSFVLTGTSLLVEGIYFVIERNYPDVNLESVNWIPLAGMLAFLLFSSFGIGILPLLMPGELFAFSVKSQGLVVFTISFGIGNFVVNMIFFYLESYAGLAGPFLLFSVCCFISAVISYYIIPETKNKSLEEIQKILSNM